MRPINATSWSFERFIFLDYLSRVRPAPQLRRPDRDRPETKAQLTARLLAAARTAGRHPLALPGAPALMREVRARIEARDAERKKGRGFKRIVADLLGSTAAIAKWGKP